MVSRQGGKDGVAVAGEHRVEFVAIQWIMADHVARLAAGWASDGHHLHGRLGVCHGRLFDRHSCVRARTTAPAAVREAAAGLLCFEEVIRDPPLHAARR